MGSTSDDIQIIKSGHEIKSEIQQKHGIHTDTSVNNKNKIRFREWPRACFLRFLENDFLKVIFQ